MVDKVHSAEISRLTDLLQNNPGSRLFVPLAEAYLKSEMPEEAVRVLSDGLETHSSFVAARVMLGKIYLKKAQLPEAKIQFEQVIAIAPSNIPSLKGLAEIHKAEGRLAEVKTFYQTILKIDPGDKDAEAYLEESTAPSEPFVTAGMPGGLTEAEAETELEAPSDGPLAPEEAPELVPSASTETSSETISEASAQAASSEALPQKEEDALEHPLEHAIEPNEAPEALEPHQTKTMAALYLKQGHHKEAADIYETLLKRNPADLESRKGLEEALAHLRDEEKPPLSNTEKIERLQSWLAAIQGEKKR